MGVSSKIALLSISFLFLSVNALAVPTATLSAVPTSGFPPLAVAFSGSCTDDNAATPIVSCTINFGDGNATIDFNTLSGPHTYYAFTTYNATMLAVNEMGQSDDSIAQINVQNHSPSAALDVSPASGYAPLAVTFTGFCSDVDGNADLASCKISFGDGNTNIVFSSGMTHTYYTTSAFAAVLTATDKQSATGTDGESVTVSAAAAPTIGNKKPSNGSYTNAVRPTVSFDVNSSGSGVNIGSLALFVDGSVVTPSTTAFGNNYFVSWQYGSDLLNGHNAKIGVRAFDNLGNYADANWSFNIDTASPSSTSISFGSGWTNNETPTFSLSASDSGSGMGSGAEIILSCIDTKPAGSIPYTTSYSSFNITTGPGCSTSDGTKTVYAWFKDAAGNWNSSSASTSVSYDNSNPSKPSAPSASAGNGQVSLSWSSVSDNLAGVDTYKIYVNGSYNSSTTGTSKTITGLSNGSSHGFRVAAVDRAGNESEWSDNVSATPTSSGSSSSDDDTEPELLWELPNSNSTVSGVVKLKVQAYDDESGIRFVEFRVDGRSVGTDYSAVNERYTFDWNSASVVDGAHTLKAIAKSFGDDEETNSRVREIRVTTNNGVTAEPEGPGEEEASDALASADDAKEEAVALLAELRAIGFNPSADALDVLEGADNLLDDAQGEFDDADYNAALTKAGDAEGMFGEFIDLFSVDDFGGAVEYVYNKEHVGLLLNGIGFSAALADEAEAMMDELSVSRTLLVKEIREGENTYYRAVVSIVAKNDSDEAKDFKIIEIIPKEFVESASMVAGEGFSVVVEDPVLEWVVSLAAGEEREINYSLKKELDQSSAEDLLDSDALEKFAVPPVMLKQDTAVPETMFSKASVPTGLFGLGAVELTGFAAIVIIVVAAALLLFNYLQGRNQGGSGLAFVGEGKGMGFFDAFRKKKEEPKKKKWAYEG